MTVKWGEKEMTIQTGRIQRFLHDYTRQLRVKEQIQKRAAFETFHEDKVTLSMEAKRLNVRDMMASKVYRKITEQDPHNPSS